MTIHDTLAGNIAKRFLLLALAVTTFQSLPTNALQGDGSYAAWKISKTEWSDQDEQNYSKFVTLIGEGVARGLCSTVSKCFRNPAVNPYASTDPAGLKFFSDCADFPYFIRAYFAWRNQLPFGYVTSVRPITRGSEPPATDVRYSSYGNVVQNRASIIVPGPSASGPKYPNALAVFNRTLSNQISSANFRVSYSGMDADGMFSDFYPVKINREAIHAGTTMYDVAGHIVTVYKITDDGRVYYLDAHTDNSLTTGIYNSTFQRSYPGQGAGFKNWRPIKLVDAQFDVTMGYYGGHIVGAKDSELPLYGTEQYYGTNRSVEWKQSTFDFQGQPMKFHTFVRYRLAKGPLVVNPVDDLRVMSDELCSTVKARVPATELASTSGMAARPHPLQLPKNIYGADGDWESYATPARDARLREAFKELREYAEEAINHQKNHDGKINYAGANLALDMIAAYKKSSEACKIVYKNSKGRPVNLTLDQVRERIYDISFDAYHCIELRWGAKGQELNSCPADANKMAWYQAERWLRFQHERATDAFTGYSLTELDGPKPGAGVESGQDLDVIAFLTRNQ